MKATEVKTLKLLVEFINECGVCLDTDGNEIVVINDDGKAGINTDVYETKAFYV